MEKKNETFTYDIQIIWDDGEVFDTTYVTSHKTHPKLVVENCVDANATRWRCYNGNGDGPSTMVLARIARVLVRCRDEDVKDEEECRAPNPVLINASES